MSEGWFPPNNLLIKKSKSSCGYKTGFKGNKNSSNNLQEERNGWTSHVDVKKDMKNKIYIHAEKLTQKKNIINPKEFLKINYWAKWQKLVSKFITCKKV